ncbi:SDE3 helicase, partial [Polypterus senegalus]
MPPTSVRHNFAVGADFIGYLEEVGKATSTHRDELKETYNEEFRYRDGNRHPNFSCVLYALLKYNKVKMRRDVVVFNPEFTTYFGDQWRRPRAKMPTSATANGPSLALNVPSQSIPITPGMGKRRRAKAIVQQLKRDRSKVVASAEGIEVNSDHDVSDGRIKFEFLPGKACSFNLYVQNKGSKTVTFSLYEPLRKIHGFTFQDPQGVSRSHPLLLHEVNFSSNFYGYYPITVVFEFSSSSSGTEETFYLVRWIAGIGRSQLAKELAPKAPYRPYQEVTRKPLTFTLEDGVPPERNAPDGLKLVVSLADYKYSDTLKKLVTHGLENRNPVKSDLQDEMAKVRELLNATLTMENYGARFQLLLHLEEIQMEVDIRKYDMRNAPMVRDRWKKNLLVLNVPGVAEHRPSVLRGDHLLASLSEESKFEVLTQYKGYVHTVELEKVKLGFSQKLLNKFVDNMKFDVTFTFNRLPLRLQHRTVSSARGLNLRDVLMPSVSYSQGNKIGKLSLYDKNLEKNPEQVTAVNAIVSGTSRPAPYLVFGPPGTGKTVTIVEAIKQVIKCLPGSHILACAPSNSASDLLCERLLKHIDTRDIYRMNARSRDPKTIPAVIKPCCNWDDDQECYVYPYKEELMHFRVIITTLLTAGRLVSGGIPSGHFTHIFIDEAGHAIESECIIPVAGLLSLPDPIKNTGTQLVLAGDPKQLGPILRSPVAIKHGLNVSLLERLMTQNSLYQKTGEHGTYNSQFVTKLLRNYRSHPDILNIPNGLFYEDELQVCADEIIRNSYCNWEHLPKPGFPVIFKGVMGQDEREENSPSFFNVAEIEEVVTYLKKILQTQGKKGISQISPKEIGIITPYRKQVEKIRTAIRTIDKELKNMKDIQELKIGSVEEFQGQERKVIIVSTVRSCQDYVRMDEEFNLGFLNNPKRFNVTVTRAKALLILVGNPLILSKDPTWARFIKYSIEHMGYVGCKFEMEDSEDDLIEQLVSLKLTPELQDFPEDGGSLKQVELEWRSDM